MEPIRDLPGGIPGLENNSGIVAQPTNILDMLDSAMEQLDENILDSLALQAAENFHFLECTSLNDVNLLGNNAKVISNHSENQTERQSKLEQTEVALKIETEPVQQIEAREPATVDETPVVTTAANTLSVEQEDDVQRHFDEDTAHSSVRSDATLIIECQICKETFELKAAFAQHMELHSVDPATYQSEVCDKTFATKHILKIHSRAHSVDRRAEPLQRPVCESLFKREPELKRHLDAKPHKCEVCDKKFRLKRHLTAHSRRRHSEKRSLKRKLHQCNICEKSFKRNAYLKRHLLRHSDARPHICEVCKKTFRSKQYLTVHSKIHSDERSEQTHQCNICKIIFKRKAYLDRHSMLHSDARSYKCEVCNVPFRYKKNLMKHSKSSCRVLKDLSNAVEMQ